MDFGGALMAHISHYDVFATFPRRAPPDGIERHPGHVAHHVMIGDIAFFPPSSTPPHGAASFPATSEAARKQPHRSIRYGTFILTLY
jgi:hypothetical protein